MTMVRNAGKSYVSRESSVWKRDDCGDFVEVYTMMYVLERLNA